MTKQTQLHSHVLLIPLTNFLISLQFQYQLDYSVMVNIVVYSKKKIHKILVLLETNRVPIISLVPHPCSINVCILCNRHGI
jgi:hypothetical protein